MTQHAGPPQLKQPFLSHSANELLTVHQPVISLLYAVVDQGLVIVNLGVMNIGIHNMKARSTAEKKPTTEKGLPDIVNGEEQEIRTGRGRGVNLTESEIKGEKRRIGRELSWSIGVENVTEILPGKARNVKGERIGMRKKLISTVTR